MKKSLALALRACLAAVVFGTVTGALALAHDQRDVGKYHFEVGFMTQPPVEGIMNGVSLRVTAGAAGKGVPVESVEKTLKVAVTHVPTGISKDFDLEPIEDDPGHYTAALIPSASGYYRFRFFGAIEGVQIDETFNSASGGGGFEDVAPVADLQFPQAVATPQEAESVARQVQQENRSTARMATVAVALGAFGIVIGAYSLALASRRKAK